MSATLEKQDQAERLEILSIDDGRDAMERTDRPIRAGDQVFHAYIGDAGTVLPMPAATPMFGKSAMSAATTALMHSVVPVEFESGIRQCPLSLLSASRPVVDQSLRTPGSGDLVVHPASGERGLVMHAGDQIDQISWSGNGGILNVMFGNGHMVLASVLTMQIDPEQLQLDAAQRELDAMKGAPSPAQLMSTVEAIATDEEIIADMRVLRAGGQGQWRDEGVPAICGGDGGSEGSTTTSTSTATRRGSRATVNTQDNGSKSSTGDHPSNDSRQQDLIPVPGVSVFPKTRASVEEPAVIEGQRGGAATLTSTDTMPEVYEPEAIKTGARGATPTVQTRTHV